MPQPIDLQTELGRLTAAERLQQIADRASLVGQQRVAADTQERSIQTETQVQQTHAQSEQVETEERRRNPFLGRKRPRAKSKDAEDAPRKNASLAEPHQLDISI